MPVSSEQQLEQKYATAISRAKQLGAKIEKSHVENDKLVLRAAVPNEDVKNQIWDAVKTIDKNFADLRLDLHIDPSLKPATAMGGGSTGGAGRTYTVQRGDTLSAIAQKFYGRANEYNKIFNANRDKLQDPDKIQVGQELKIPE